MTWGCKPENYPGGCGWSSWVKYPTLGLREWWCDLCERSDTTTATGPVDRRPSDLERQGWAQLFASYHEAMTVDRITHEHRWTQSNLRPEFRLCDCGAIDYQGRVIPPGSGLTVDRWLECCNQPGPLHADDCPTLEGVTDGRPYG